ncbi:ThiF family adenylyltransferase [Microbacterium esteraromaticum]|uniref:ThiF family adenylyltransferase n=1 Tax=Microbacterium esteraromaticum TaxID=57043 RepID=UPI0019568A4D|nr:ThiF family adenylyltransferase [Microbacterium esteraromaticum]MBM7465563.1 adenylyltransferase/sulfurtransferase [Microbacterium esteraromaticum]
MPVPPLVEPVAVLSDAESARTARHQVLAGLGEIGQRRLRAAHVAVVGAGGLGAPVVLALAAAGIGEITVIDDDDVELSNLQRQVMHRRSDVGRPKVDSAVRVAADLSPETVVHAKRARLASENAADLLAGADLVIDGTDTFETRLEVAAVTERLGIPLVWGVIQEFAAQITVFWSAPPQGTDAVVLSDLYPAGSVGELPTCAAVGVFGALCLQAGSILAMEAIKLITGIGDPLLGRVLVIDALRAKTGEVPLRPSRATAPAPQPERAPHVAVADLEAEIAAGAALLDVREDAEVADGMIPGAQHVPLAQVLADPAAIDAGRIVVICQVGARARRAADALRAAGADAVVLAGGMDAWTTGLESLDSPHSGADGGKMSDSNAEGVA